MRGPGLGEDAKNLSVITASGLVAVVLTAGLLFARAAPDQTRHRVRSVRLEPLADLGPVSGSPRLYGSVVTRDGTAHRGFIRWDRNEGSWSDLLDANKLRRRGTTAQSGIRFGHVRRIDVLSRQGALFTLKSGDQVEMGARATDLGSGLRALLVDDPDTGRTLELRWGELESVVFEPAPERVTPREARLYGTLATRSGLEFEGYIAWDVDEIYTTDVLDGDDASHDRRKIPFGSIAAIERYGSRAAKVTLVNGEQVILRGTNDVDASNNGITVSDAALGQAKVDWGELESVRFHRPRTQPGYGSFDGGERLYGTVLTELGEELSGEIAWDNDEEYSWEMLNGDVEGVELHVEFSRIARIEKTSRGALVELRDGRVFELGGSNDVDEGNRGITIRSGGGAHEVEWESFRELRLTR
ncbi:MAG: hypothetical protein P8170_09165 [Gemmatimonadota bacterium]